MLRLSLWCLLWCVLWGTSCLLFVYVRHFSKHFYSIIFTEALENVSTWKTEIYILFFIMKNIAEWIFINTLFSAFLREHWRCFLRLFLPYPGSHQRLLKFLFPASPSCRIFHTRNFCFFENISCSRRYLLFFLVAAFFLLFAPMWLWYFIFFRYILNWCFGFRVLKATESTKWTNNIQLFGRFFFLSFFVLTFGSSHRQH